MNCDKDIRAYHRECVTLTRGQRQQLKDRRDSNRKRLRRGLEKNEEPAPKRWVSQGSYAMRTVIQEPDDGYDIDDGVVFTKEALIGPRGADKSPLDARKMVRDAVHSDSFSTPPEVKTNCVRVYYNDGPQVDIPVYREITDWRGDPSYELASAEWKKSDPDGVNDWFEDELRQKNSSGLKHSRELIRLLKSICKNRPSASLPSGFVITVLVLERYLVGMARLDADLRQMIRAVYDRLRSDLRVAHPVVSGEWLIDDGSLNKTRDLRDLLGKAVNNLDCLDLPNCTRSRALKAWKKVLRTDFFDALIADAEKDEKATSAAAAVSSGLATAPRPYAPATTQIR